jgi:hypothetical protein
MAETNELAWLATATPKASKFLATPRGRAPGSNPVQGHVAKSLADNKPYTISVPSQHAFKTERMLRRAALALGKELPDGKSVSLSVQVLKADPDAASTNKDDVIPLKDIAKLPAGSDAWITYHATEKDDSETETKSTENGSAPAAGADPFQGTPDVDKADAAPAATVAKTPAVRKPVAASK